MYNFSDFASLIGFLVVLAIVYILFKWLQRRRKGDRDDEDERQDGTI